MCPGEQAAQLSRELADLQGQNQNEQLAVPLLRLAGAVQAALTWQHKVHAAFLSCPLLLAFCLLASPLAYFSPACGQPDSCLA